MTSRVSALRFHRQAPVDCTLHAVYTLYLSHQPLPRLPPPPPGANILVNELGICKLADFGASRQLDGSQTRQLEASLKAIRGTVPFMAPEVIRQTGHGLPADIWSLGATVIEMASGSPPCACSGCHSALRWLVQLGSSSPAGASRVLLLL